MSGTTCRLSPLGWAQIGSPCWVPAPLMCRIDDTHKLKSGVLARRTVVGPRCATATPADIKLEAMENADRRRAPALPYRVGHGFDLHRLEEGPYKLILGGLEIPHDRGCVAHSDGEQSVHSRHPLLSLCRSSRSLTNNVRKLPASFACPELQSGRGSHALKDVCYHTGDALLHTVTGDAQIESSSNLCCVDRVPLS